MTMADSAVTVQKWRNFFDRLEDEYNKLREVLDKKNVLKLYQNVLS